jgi:hypothetical protein|tara:strand:+ start:155 stop:307 length:153 start_codon:yes stop_codon:yes gene_type:complete
MAQKREIQKIKHIKKATSQGLGGRSRRVKISTKHLNKRKPKRSRYRGQGR